MKKRRKKTRIKKQKKTRRWLVDVNQHCEQLTKALRDLADRLDDIRSYHLNGD